MRVQEESPITFEAPSFALFDVEKNAVCTTAHGNLAIFSVKAMAEIWARKTPGNIAVIPVQIARASIS